MKIENGLDPTPILQEDKLAIKHERTIGFKFDERGTPYPNLEKFPSLVRYPRTAEG